MRFQKRINRFWFPINSKESSLRVLNLWRDCHVGSEMEARENGPVENRINCRILCKDI
jgi:hypothetical protein